MDDDPVIVVGGGIAGLICANTLASAGRAVHVLDAGGRLGGRASTSRHDGYLLNEGAHALYPSSERLLSAAGVRVTGRHPRPDRGRVLHGGDLLPSPLGPHKVLAPGPLSARERVQFIAAMAAAGTRQPARLAGSTARSWVAKHSTTPLLADLLAGLLRVSTYCGDLDALPGDLGVGMLRETLRKPVRYIDGGWQEIVSALATRAQSNGAQLHTGARAQELLVDGAVAGVRLTDGQEHRARAVVLAGLSPTRAARFLTAAGGELPAAIREPRPVRAACLDVALSELPRPDCPFVLGLDEPLYLSVHSTWSKLTPSRGAVVQLLRYDDGSEPTADAALAQLESLLDQAQPGWREHVVHRRFAPRLIASNHLPSPAGGLATRPAVDDTGLAGTFIAGDWVGSQGWLVGASLHSGVAAAQAVVRMSHVPRAAVPATRAA